MKHFNELILIISIALSSVVLASQSTSETNSNESYESNEEVKKSKVSSDWMLRLKEKYQLSDEQVRELEKSGLSSPNVARVAELSYLSGKSIEEVLKMRNESKMGWGKIAQELGIHPSKLGSIVSGLRKEKNEDKREMREMKRERTEKRERKGKGN